MIGIVESEKSLTLGKAAAFEVLQGEWIQVAPLGDHPHAEGIQRIGAVEVATMVRSFNGFLARLGRLFSGVPIYKGHPDIDAEEYPDKASYGWIMELQDRGETGMWGRVKWTEDGWKLVSGGSFKFVSPVWRAIPLGVENDRQIFQPAVLVSVGLTNMPNIEKMLPLANAVHLASPLPPGVVARSVIAPSGDWLPEPPQIGIPNCNIHRGEKWTPLPCASPDNKVQREPLELQEREQFMEKAKMKTLMEILAVNGDASAEEICAAAQMMANARVTEKNRAETLAADLEAARRRGELERGARIDLLLENALLSGRMALSEQARWKGELAQNFETAEKALRGQEKKLNVESQTRELGNEKGVYDTEATRRSFLTGFMAEKMGNGMSHLQAWQLAKTAHPQLFEKMRR